MKIASILQRVDIIELFYANSHLLKNTIRILSDIHDGHNLKAPFKRVLKQVKKLV